MKLRIHILVAFFIIFSPKHLWAEYCQLPGPADSLCQITGKVYSATNPFPIANARIRITDSAGRNVLTASDDSGNFIFKDLHPGVFKMKVTHLGYEPFSTEYDFTPGNCIVYVKLKASSERIEASSVTAQVALMRRVRDTTIFNASAIRTDEWDDAIAILQQIPGADVKNGRITINGETVARTFVNGKLIFGDEPITAFNALKASDVKQIKVYDELSIEDQRIGKKNGRKERIINIITKDLITSQIRGLALAAGGANTNNDSEGKVSPLYLGHASANLHSEYLQINLQAGSNSLNTDPEDPTSPTMWNTIGANSTMSDAKLGISKYWGDRIFGNKLNLSYIYKSTKTSYSTLSKTDFLNIEDDIPLSFRDSSANNSFYGEHSIRAQITMPDTRLKHLRASLGLTFRNNKNKTVQSHHETFGDSNNVTEDNNVNSAKFKELHGFLEWKHNNLKTVKPYSLINIGYSHDRKQLSVIDTLGPASYPKRVLQGTGKEGDFTLAWDSGVNIFLKNEEKRTMMLRLNYYLSYENLHDRHNTLDWFIPSAPVTDTINTFNYRNAAAFHSISCGFSYDTRSISIHTSLKPTLKVISDSDVFPEEYENKRRYFAVCPSFSFSYNNRIKAEISTDTYAPSMMQTRKKIDDRIQNRLIAGNPELDQEYKSSLSVKYSTKPEIDKPVIESGVTGTLTFNPIVSAMNYITAGTMIGGYDYTAPINALLTTYDNAPLAAQLSWTFRVSDQIRKIRSPYHISIGYAYRMLPQMSEGNLINLHEHTPSLEGRFSYRSRKGFRLSLNGNIGYINAKNNDGTLINNSITGKASVRITYKFLNRYELEARNTFVANNVLNLDYLYHKNTLSCSFTAEILKGRLYMTASGHDLLNKEPVYTIKYTGNSYVQEWKPTVGRYFMLTIKWKFRKNFNKN